LDDLHRAHTWPHSSTPGPFQEMKSWLTSKGFEDAVFEANNRRPAPKKSDWMQLVKDKCGV